LEVIGNSAAHREDRLKWFSVTWTVILYGILNSLKIF